MMFYRILTKAKQMNVLILAAINKDSLIGLNGRESIVTTFVKYKHGLVLSDNIGTFSGVFDCRSVNVKSRSEQIRSGKGVIFTDDSVLRIKFID